MSIIEAKQLSKSFRRPVKDAGLTGSVKHLFKPHYESKLAVDRASFSIDTGKSVAYVGSNGAGMSKPIKLFTG